MGVLSWELPHTSQCETGHKAISRQDIIAETSILVFWLVRGGLRLGQNHRLILVGRDPQDH